MGDKTARPANTALRRLRALLIDVGLVLVAAVAAIAVGLWVTPMQQVSAAGQLIEVGVTAPSWSTSGPGELDLFGQQIPTTTTFAGPVRPRLRLSRITLSQQLAEFTGASSGGDPTQSLEDALVTGWHRYFYWEIAVVAIAAVVLLGAVCGWLRRGWRQTTMLIALGLVAIEAINVGAIMITAYTAPQKLRQVHSLQALVGDAPALPMPPVTNPDTSRITVAVIGDSTAAGLGNRPLPHPSPDDTACQRSLDTYALDLASANGWDVTNLACSGATIAEGILAPQTVGDRTIAAQIDAPSVREASTVILSVGANDVEWSNLLRVCAVSASCANNALQAYFQQHLAAFSSNYLQLLNALQTLPNHPRVLVNLYYEPFTPTDACLSSLGISSDKQRSMLSLLQALNDILRQGAQAASFASTQPDFSGHGLCSPAPWVQGVNTSAPFHPTAAGELGIALADEHALNASPGR